MQKTNTIINRRNILRGALGAIGTLTAVKAVAEVCGTTPAQPEGPFYPLHPQLDKDFDMTKVNGLVGSAVGEQVLIVGTVVDENCQPVAGALVDLWQACHTGKYKHEQDPNDAPLDPNFQYWAKVLTNENGEWMVKTIIPGAYPAGRDWVRPPHIHFKVSKLGFHTLTTQMYFDDERFNRLNSKDLLLQSLPAAEQQKLMVRFADELVGPAVGRFNIALNRV